MQYLFSAGTQALLEAGKLVQVVTATGQLLPTVRDPITGRFVEIAKAVVQNSSQMLPESSGLIGHFMQLVAGGPIQPLLAPAQLIMAPLQMVQTHLGFQKTYRILETLQNSVGVLQATTALIGVGTVAGVALSAVNLHQTLKLRKDVEQLRLEVTHGFIDLKQALKDQSVEIIARIDQVAEDVEFGHHRTILVQAYGRFLEATRLIKTALSCEDMNIRNADLANARQILTEALGDYKNSRLLSDTCAAGQLRRMECAWVIEQTIALTYQLQNQPAAVSDRLSHLLAKIRQDSLTVIEHCKSEDELDFLFPEITRIHTQDVAVLESWKNQVDWMHALSPDERQQLASLDATDTASSDNNKDAAILAEPAEQALYESLKQKSHYPALRDQLRFIVKPDLRRDRESYIRQQAIATNYKALAPSNWQEIPDLTVANLYHFFKAKEESKQASAMV